jgi:hypothetical protein
LGNLFDKIKAVITEAKEYHLDSPSAVFRLFVAVVLIQFSVLSLVNIESNGSFHAVDTLENTVTSAKYWWGISGLYGAVSLLFERYIKGSLPLIIAGYVAAIISLASLSYDYITTKPPVHTGGILAATTVVFLGGLLYGRIKRR